MSSARRDQIFWLAGLVVVTACSWGRWLATGSLKVDENYPTARVGTLLFIALVIGWALFVRGWIGFMLRPPERPRMLAYIGVGIASLMLPMLSNDLYIILSESWAAARGRDVFTSAESVRESPWFAFVGDHWKSGVCKYGPLSLFATMPAAYFDHSPLLARFVLRATWLVPLVATMELAFRTTKLPPFAHVFVWLNPLFLVEGPGQLHLDLLGFTAIAAGVLLQSRMRLAIFFFALALLCKWNWILAAPWFVLAGATSFAEQARRALWMIAIVTLVAVALYVPFWEGAKTILVPVRAWGDQNPGGSMIDVIGELGHVIRSAGHPVFDPNASIADLVAQERATRMTTWTWTAWSMRGIALVVAIPVALRTLRARGEELAIALGTGSLIVIVVTLVSPVFQSWYLMAALPFFAISCPPAWRRWWMLIVALSVTEAFPLMLPRDAALFPIWVALSTGTTAFAFLFWLRSRYVRV